MSMLDRLASEALICSLLKMFASSYFTVCPLEDMMKLCSGERYTDRMPPHMKDSFQALHCVDFAKMDPAFCAALPRTVLEALLYCCSKKVGEFDIEAVLAEFQKRNVNQYFRLEEKEVGKVFDFDYTRSPVKLVTGG